MSQDRIRIIIAIAVIAAMHAVYTGYQVSHRHFFLGPDSFEYIHAAENLPSGVLYSGDRAQPIDTDLYTKRPILYPLILAGVFRIHHSEVAVILLQMLIAIGTAFLAIRFMRELDIIPSRRGVLILFACLAATPSHFMYANFIMTETVLQAIVLGMTLMVFLFLSRGHMRYLIGYQCLLVAAMLTKPVFYLFVIPSLLYWAWLSLRIRTARPLTAAIIPVLAVILVTGWNYSRTGYAQYSSIQTLGLFYYNTYYFLIKTKGDAYAKTAIADIETAAAREKSYADRTKLIHRTCGALLRSEAVGYALFHARGMMTFFLDPGRFDFHNFFGMSSDNTGLLYHFSRGGFRAAALYLSRQPPALIVSIIVVMLGNVLKIAGAGVFLFSPRVRLEFRIFAVGIIFYVAFATGPLGATRFAVPILPILFICLAALLSRVTRPGKMA
ncbi:MAG: glycosyltransferase family 39 protein [Spirochaetota bacterium]